MKTKNVKHNGPKVLLLDIETMPMIGFLWGIWDQNVGLNQIKQDWHVASWAAKWLNEKKVMYQDQRNVEDITDDAKLLKGIWKLLDQADIIITQNGKAFDIKKLNARFLEHGMQPPSSFKHIDTKQIAKKYFAFTSNRLEYMTDKFNTRYKKLKHKQFPGFEMWLECMKGNLKAWKAMEKYNKYDVLSLEELYLKLIPWDNTIDFSLYTDKLEHVCTCGSKDLKANGYAYTATGKFQRYKCNDCGRETRSKVNIFSKDKKMSLKTKG